jgi:probable addiction module antidote protein
MRLSPFNSADYLDNEDVIVAYLTAALENPDSNSFLMALSNAAKARGIEKVAKHSGLGRRTLQKALAPGAKPPFETVHKLMNALGVRWTVVSSTAPRLTQIRERLARRPAVTTRITAAEVLRRERNRR